MLFVQLLLELTKKFIDKDAEFVFIDYPRKQPKPKHGTPFDIKGVELGHKNGKCTFEVVVKKYKVENPFVKKVAGWFMQLTLKENFIRFLKQLES